MYKVEVSEKEARDIGESRWVVKHKWYLLTAFFSLLVAFVLGLLSLPNKVLTISPWVGVPFGIVLFGVGLYFVNRGSRLCTKAGKEFIQSLKKEE
jgi:hypothetical protein